jgi:hypothetical protein
VTRRLVGDYHILDWQKAGLLYPSTVTGIVRTIKRTATGRRLGAIAAQDQAAIDHEQCRSVGL